MESKWGVDGEEEEKMESKSGGGGRNKWGWKKRRGTRSVRKPSLTPTVKTIKGCGYIVWKKLPTLSSISTEHYLRYNSSSKKILALFLGPFVNGKRPSIYVMQAWNFRTNFFGSTYQQKKYLVLQSYFIYTDNEIKNV